jgi:cell division protein FtsB
MRSRKFDTAVTIVCLSLLGYFGWHATQGPRGFSYTERLAGEAEARQRELGALVTEREKLDARVALMRPESIDPDMLDELARATLGVARPEDLIVLTPD